jgi:hypothetical protein
MDGRRKKKEEEENPEVSKNTSTEKGGNLQTIFIPFHFAGAI